MSTITTEFAAALGAVNQPADYFVAGTERMYAPGLTVAGVGQIALPLLPAQAEQLIAVAEQAPYGRGAETLTDTSVRRTWQVAPSQVRLASKHWPATLQAIVARVAQGLGVASPIGAELYKLLIYDQGSFFVLHRDTEKTPGMFATLVLAMPSISEGGELVVRHKDREARLALLGEDPSEFAFAAFYADCVHEVLPVTSGNRLVLVYNLVRRGSGRLPSVPDYNDQQAAIAALLRDWAKTPRDPKGAEPEKLIYLLEHAYTQAELGFGTLKGADASIAQVVAAAAEHAGCDVHLALLSIEESGGAEYNGTYGRRRSHSNDDDDGNDFEAGDVEERNATLSDWRRPDNAPSPLTQLPVEEDEFSPPMEFDEIEPDEEHFQEATGNAGASFERSYRRTALVLWPSDRVLAVINQAGQEVTLPYLEDLANRWADSGEAPILVQAHALTAHMLSAWPAHQWHRSHDPRQTNAGRFLNLLVRLQDTAKIDAFLVAIAEQGGFDTGDGQDIADALLALRPDRATALANTLVTRAAESAFAACGIMLARLSAVNPAIAAEAARTLVAALPSDRARKSAEPLAWRQPTSVQSAFVIDMLTTLGRIDPTLAAAAVKHVLASPTTYDQDTVLVPATRTLLDQPETAGQDSVRRLQAAALAHLDARISEPLEAPKDWRRDSQLGCNCEDCQTLKGFLADAAQPVWVFRAAEPRRRHVDASIRTARCDVDMATERSGSPHRLVCTKNQASYQRRCAQRLNDLAERDRLAVSPSPAKQA